VKTLAWNPLRAVRPMAIMAIGFLAACETTPKAPRPLEPASTNTAGSQPTTAPEAGPVASVSGAPSARYPALEDACKTDTDCALFDEEIADAPPRTFTCCGGCTERAATKEWLGRFRAACQTSRPPMCPPLGCAMPLLRAVCTKGHCATSQR
jgi:hypothetical protein